MKYNADQLRQMARQAFEAKRTGDGRYLVMIQRLSARTGLHPLQCELKILFLAGYN